MISGMSLDLLQSSGEFPCAVCCTGVGSNSIFCNDCKPRVHKKCSGLKRLTKDPDYRCTTCPLDGRPKREVQVGPQAGGGSFLLLPRRHALSRPWLWTFNHNTCENWLEEVQGAVISSLFPPPLFQDTWPCVTVNSSCVQSAMLNASEHWPLTKPNLQRLQRNDRAMIWQCQAAMSSRKTLSPSDPMSYLHSLALRIWTSSWRREGSTDMHTLHTPRVQSRDPVTYRLMESEGPEGEGPESEGGPRWHGSSWQRGITESGSYWLLTLMIWCEICHACSKPATWKGANWCGCCPCTCMFIKKFGDDDDVIFFFQKIGHDISYSL